MSNDKRIGIINHWMVNNYGALLLAYAIERAVVKLGWQVESVTYLPDEIRKPWKLSIVPKIGCFTYILRLGYFLVFILPRQKSFSRIRAKMNTSKRKYTDNTIGEIVDKYDKFVIGGDQLWNTAKNSFNEANFLPFVSEKRQKVVYAASVAQPDVRPEILNRFKTLVEGFGYITSREDQTRLLIEKYTSCQAPRVADPAFLLSDDEWIALEDKDKNLHNDFIFVYQVQSDIELIDFVKQLASEKKLEVIYCPFPLKKQISCKRRPYISPERWLWYVRNAKYVVTDAFHGTLFSILHNTQFYAQISSYGRDTSSRIDNILKVFSLEDRLLINGQRQNDAEIDFRKVNETKAHERDAANKHLQAMIEF
jgi:hypothetical protein